MITLLTEFYQTLKTSALKPIYLVASDVTLLQQEARAAIRQTATQAGYVERQTIVVEAGFDWELFFAGLKNLNLFSPKITVEITNPTAKFDDKATKNLLAYLENPQPDRVLIVLTDKLTSAQQKTRWYQAIDKHGVALTLRAVTKAELPHWITQRAKMFNLNFDRASTLLLAELTEGNLLATHQALQKLQLLYPQKLITSDKILQVMSDNARFSVFDLGNLLLNGDGAAALRCLRNLKNTGTDPTLISWAMCREIRDLIKLIDQQNQGVPLQKLLQQQWQARRPLLQAALKRFSLDKLHALLLLAQETDFAIKGVTTANAWVTLEKIVLHFSTQAQKIYA